MSSDSIDFLRAVLPDKGEGYYSLHSPHRRFKDPNKIEFVTTVEELWELQQSYLGRGDVYFSACTFKMPDKKNAKTGNVFAKRAFQLDFDFDPADAYEVINENFVDKLGLPEPIFISTGRGLHAWWPLTSIDLNYWGRIAEGLKDTCKKLCKELSIRIDHGPTINLVGLGRCPGTFNYRHGDAREVRFYKEPSFERYDPSVFDHLAVVEPEKPAARSAPVGNGDRAYYLSMLAALKDTDNYDRALHIGMIVHTFGWEDGFEVWRDWYRQTPEAQSKSAASDEKLRSKWEGFDDTRGLTGGSLYQWAVEAEWDPSAWPRLNGPDSSSSPNGESTLNGFDAGDPLAVHWHAISKIDWIKLGTGAYKRREYENARKAVAKEQIEGRYDCFTNCTEFRLPWEKEKGWQDYSDERKKLNRAVRDHLCNEYGDLGLANVEDALKEIARLCSYNSIVDYLDRVEKQQWEGESLLNTWLIKYCHAEDTTLNRAIGELVLVAAVRRARKPGSKFDHLLILEGDEGIGKSRVVQILAGDEKYFSDEPILTEDARRQHELLEGKWFYEISEFHGIRRTEADHLKAFVTRNVDRSRKAYARECTSSSRTCVCIVTTNYTEDKYLQDEMGLRRFWPVKIGEVDQNGLIRDRDQLFAEASLLEKDYGYLDIPEDLQEPLCAEQKKRRFDPEFLDALRSLEGQEEKDTAGRVLREIITTKAIKDSLNLPIQYHNTANDRRISQAMKQIGWEPARLTIDGKDFRGWERKC